MPKETVNEMRGQFEVTIDGKPYKGWTTTNALRLFVRDNNSKLEDIGKLMDKDQLGSIGELAYYSCVNYSVRKDTKLGINKEKFISYFLDDMEQANDVGAIILSSLGPQTVEADEKK